MSIATGRHATDPGRSGTYLNTARLHHNIGSDEVVQVRGQRVDATLTLEDGRSVQVGLLNNGHVTIRAWAAEPYATNNAEALSLSFHLPVLEDMVLDGAQVSEVNMRTSPLSERSLASERGDSTWHLANQNIKDRITAIKMVLGLRRKPTTEVTR